MDLNTNLKRKCVESTEGSKVKVQKVLTDYLKRDVKSELNEKSKNDEKATCVSNTSCCSMKDESTVVWKELRAENLNCDYCVLYNKKTADQLLRECEKTLIYNEGQLAKVKVFGKWHDIPRKQVAFGDSGLAYTFSNTTVPAQPWIPLLEQIRDKITEVTGYTFNFVLVNRYKDGHDRMGEHRDDEKELVSGYPIASLSLGQPRDFVFKHGDARGKTARRSIPPVVIELGHGGLLMMNHPTNTYWYHSLPQRKRLTNVRINMTFRKMVVK